MTGTLGDCPADRGRAGCARRVMTAAHTFLAATNKCLCRCRHKVHKHRNLLACAPERLHDEITADYTDMIYAATPQDIADRRKAFIRKWRLRHKAVADSLEEAGDALFAFAALPSSQWKSARTTNAIEREAPFGNSLTLAVSSRRSCMRKPVNHVIWANWRFEMVDMDGRRVDAILAQRQP